MPTSGSTLLRTLHNHPLPKIETPKVVGIDDWAYKKRLSYGTVVVDLERRKIIDLLKDREEQTVTNWLRRYPEIEVSPLSTLTMAAKTIQMDLLKQVIRLHRQGIPISQIAKRLGIVRNTVKKYLKRLPPEETQKIPDPELSHHLYNTDHKVYKDLRHQQLLQHFDHAVKELSLTGVNRRLLHEEYLHAHPDGYRYSQYCYHLADFLRQKDVVMHLQHAPADQLMVDFTGKTFPYVNQDTGEVISCQVLVAVLPHSGYTFCYAVHSQKIPDFIKAITEALHYMQGAPLTILCDNLKTAVTRSCRVEPTFTEACYQLSEHYSTSFSATRPYSPKDKAMVERSVNIIYSQVFARLRKEVFSSISEVNEAFLKMIQALNQKKYKGSSLSRLDLFTQNEQALLKPLPLRPFTLKSVSRLMVQNNYHIELRALKQYFSVPYIYVGKRVSVLWDPSSVLVYYEQKLIAIHLRWAPCPGKYSTLAEHMPPSHFKATELRGLSEEKLTALAKKIGPHTLLAVKSIIEKATYPQQAFKSCNAIIMLQKQYGKERLEAACAHALAHTRINYHLVKTILKSGGDKQPLLHPSRPASTVSGPLQNIRGAASYN
ncbi:hypothetical protein OJ253_3707 [Cryptosporidium canis]|uniref:Integrase catalytic domain-containing protein n=1 Tax=Cryptosporidium canis TaxID=195482 RepID=A0A9D5HUJ6_9CRYT|nr:hypothetical protein OJ253_3707 [Cryptosporidium canis]